MRFKFKLQHKILELEEEWEEFTKSGDERADSVKVHILCGRLDSLRWVAEELKKEKNTIGPITGDELRGIY